MRRGLGLLLAGAAASLTMIAAPVAQAGWLAPVDISDAGEHAGSPHVVLDSSGNATAVWDRWNGNDMVVESSYRPAGEDWQTPEVLSDAEGEASSEGAEGAHDAQYPRIAVDAHGDVTVVWERYASTKMLIQTAYRPAGGSWQTPVTIGEMPLASAPEPWIAVDAHGDATAVWKAGEVIHSAYRPAGEDWEAPVDVSGSEAFVPQAAVDAQGDATVVWVHDNGSHFVVQSAYRPAGGDWETPVELSEPGEEGGDPEIALDGQGDAMVAWEGHPSEYADVARVSYRPAGGSWQAPVDISSEGELIESLRVALDAHGDAMIAWAGSSRELGDYSIARVAYRAADGDWEEPIALSEGGGNAFPSDLEFDAAGNAAILWQRGNGNSEILQADYRPAGAAWQAPTNLSREGADAMDAVLVLDAPGDATAADGDATAVWTSGNDGGCRLELHCVGSYLVQAAGYDIHEAPSEGLEVPATGTVGTPVEVSVPTEDVYSPVLEFGDGTSSSVETSTAHTYSQPGKYKVVFKSTELLGYQTSVQSTITISSRVAPEEEDGPGSPEGEGSKVAGGSDEAEGKVSSGSGVDDDQAGGLVGLSGAAKGRTGTLVAPQSARKTSMPILSLKWATQNRMTVLEKGSVRVTCYLSAPGRCIVRGKSGGGRTTVGARSPKAITIKLSARTLRAIRRRRESTLAFTVIAVTNDHHTVKRLVTLRLR